MIDPNDHKNDIEKIGEEVYSLDERPNLTEVIGDLNIANYIDVKRLLLCGYFIKEAHIYQTDRYGDNNPNEINPPPTKSTVTSIMSMESNSNLSKSDDIFENLQNPPVNYNKRARTENNDHSPLTDNSSPGINQNINNSNSDSESDTSSESDSEIEIEITNDDKEINEPKSKTSKAILLLKSGIYTRTSTLIFFNRIYNEAWKLTKKMLTDEEFKCKSTFSKFYYTVLDRDLPRSIEPINECTIQGNISNFLKSTPDMLLTFIYGGLPYVSYAGIKNTYNNN